jgi:protein-S-isoprenylcysteine O-methyltransferase Ste14
VHSFVVLYEEPTLHRMFGEEYDDYRRSVNRWMPRRPRS